MTRDRAANRLANSHLKKEAAKIRRFFLWLQQTSLVLIP